MNRLVGQVVVQQIDAHQNLVRLLMPPGNGTVGVRLRRAGETNNELPFTYATTAGAGGGGGGGVAASGGGVDGTDGGGTGTEGSGAAATA